MAQFTNIPFLSPFKWYKSTETPDIHFDDDWFYGQLKSFSQRRPYVKKWQWKDSTKQQITSTITPSALQIRSVDTGELLDSANWTLVASGGATGANVYECTVNLDAAYNLGEHKRLILYFECTQGLTSFKFITEPIWVEDLWPNTLLFNYYNTYNDFGAVFSSGWKPYFRIEAGIMDMTPDRVRTAFVSELNDTTTQSATPFRTYKLYIGKAPGVAPWAADLMNRIFCCNRVMIGNDPGVPGKRYESTDGSKWEINRQKGNECVGMSIDITEAFNENSLQQSTEGLTPGIVVSYIHDTNFFGVADEIQMEEITITN